MRAGEPVELVARLADRLADFLRQRVRQRVDALDELRAERADRVEALLHRQRRPARLRGARELVLAAHGGMAVDGDFGEHAPSSRD